MTRLTRNIVSIVIMSFMMAFGLMTTSAQADAQIRFVHVIPDVAPVDVYVNGVLAAKNLEFGTATGYVTVPSGDHSVSVTPTGLTAALWQQNISLGDGSATTFVASDGAAPQFAAFSDNLTATDFGNTRLELAHALAGAPNVTVQLAEAIELGGAEQPAGTTIVPDLAYGAESGEFDIPAQTYTVDVLPVGGSDAVVSGLSLSLSSGTNYLGIVYGSLANPQALLLSSRTTPADGSSLVRFVHGIVGGPTVDVLVNDTLFVSGLTPENPTEHVALPAGDHDVTYVATGTEDAVGSAKISTGDVPAQTVAALLVDGEPAISVFADDVSTVSSTSAGASVLNTIDGATVTVQLADGTVIGEASSGEQSAGIALDPAVTSTSFTIALGDDEGTLEGGDLVVYGGNYYNVIVLDGSMFGAPSLLIAPSTIAQTLESAPGADSTIVVTGDPAPPQSEDTTAPVATEAPAASQPVVAEGEDVILGEIALDPSANLNLRQFPNTEALILGQAPSGGRLEILGREGIPVALVEGQDPPPEAADYVDPVLALGEDEDLDSTQTWLRVLYNTPDSGQVEAWTLAQYLIITDDEGLVDLRDLEPTASNIPGETRNTDITPPPAPVDIVTAEVINLNADASLNIRRNPSADSEVLAQLPLGTVVELGGLLVPELEAEVATLLDAEWAFISYSPAEGGVITGWVSTNFIGYLLNGETESLEDLIEINLVEEADGEVIGEINANAAPVVAATPDPQEDAYVAEIALDPGANLNLRRTPTVDGEVLQQIPSGTFVIVTERTADNEWLETSYEGDVGWVASQFVIVTFNGDFVGDLTEIPVDSTIDTTTEQATETP